MANMYGIQNLDVFIAADGGKNGHLVTDANTFAKVGEVVTTPFTAEGLCREKNGYHIDAFKLAMVRYYKPDVLPDWVPELF